MSTYTSEPGTRLAGRYRLVDQMSAGQGWTYWKATDETLARPITVLTFAPGFPRVAQVITAARAAGRLGDPRFAQVFDVEDVGEQAYVVLEWVTGETLADMVAEGPLEPARAIDVMAEAAQALAAAHAAGLAHLRLDPSALHWTQRGGVKISGLGMEAALAGPALTLTDSPEVTDARDLGRLLYAGLTGYWPGPGDGQLPPAPPGSDGEPCTPRQVSAGVPAGLDAVTCRAAFQQANRQGPPLSSPAEFADALARVAPPAPLPPAAPQTRPQRAAGGGYAAPGGYAASGYDGPTNQYPASDTDNAAATVRRGGSPGYRRRYPQTERSATRRGILSVVIVAVLVAVGVAGWALSRGSHSANAGTGTRQQQLPSTVASGAPGAPLTVASAHSYNPLGSGPEDEDDAKLVIAPPGGGFWHTSFYKGSAVFGGLKTGDGLILDMGSAVRLSQLQVQFGGQCCMHVNIEIGNSNSADKATLGSFTTVATNDNASGLTTFNISSKATGRYVLIWITSLPPLKGSTGEYEAFIYHVIARGTTA